MRSQRPVVPAVLLAAAVLAGCGDDAPRTEGAADGSEPLTPRALAAVVAEHTGEPSSGQRGTDMEELGNGLVAAVELRYPDEHLLSVGVGTGVAESVGDCDALTEQGIGGCEQTADGLVFWEEEAPEEDPGVVYVLASKGSTDVLFFLTGPAITGNPRELDLAITVEDMFAIAADPRVDVTTSPAAVEAGRDLAFWSETPT